MKNFAYMSVKFIIHRVSLLQQTALRRGGRRALALRNVSRVIVQREQRQRLE